MKAASSERDPATKVVSERLPGVGAQRNVERGEASRAGLPERASVHLCGEMPREAQTPSLAFPDQKRPLGTDSRRGSSEDSLRGTKKGHQHSAADLASTGSEPGRVGKSSLLAAEDRVASLARDFSLEPREPSPRHGCTSQGALGDPDLEGAQGTPRREGERAPWPRAGADTSVLCRKSQRS